MHASENKVKICLVSKFFYPLYAGPGVRFFRYAPGLKMRGIKMNVFTSQITKENILRDGILDSKYYKGSNEIKLPPNKEKISGIYIHRVKTIKGWRGSFSFFWRFFKYALKNKDDIDVIQFLNISIWAIPCLVMLKYYNFPLVFTHTLMSPFSSNVIRSFFQRTIRKLPLNLLDRIIVSSKVMKDDLSAMKLKPSIDIIYNGVNLEKFFPIKDKSSKIELRKSLGFNTSNKIILMIGPVIPRKGIDVLVKAFSILSHDLDDINLILVGPRHDLNRPDLNNFREEIQNDIAGSNIKNKIFFVGEKTNVENYLQISDIFVFPSRREGMPNVVPEAMASGLPVVMTPFIGLSDDFGKKNKHYILSDWNPLILSQDIKKIITDKKKIAEFSFAGRELVEEKLNVSKSLDDYALLYKNMKNRKK